jgi:hypothetical protein
MEGSGMTHIKKIVIHSVDKPDPLIVDVNILGPISAFELLAMKGVISIGPGVSGRGALAWAVQDEAKLNHLSDTRYVPDLWELVKDVLDFVTLTDDDRTLVVHTLPSADRESGARRVKLEKAGVFIESVHSLNGRDTGEFSWYANLAGYTVHSRSHSSFGSALNDAEAFQKAMVNMADNAVYKVKQAFEKRMADRAYLKASVLANVLAQLDDVAKSHFKDQP